MEAVQKDHWYFMVLLIFLPFLKVAVQQRQAAVPVRLEEGMVLDCLCPWDGNLSMVSWTKIPDKSPLAVFHPEYGVAFSHHYRERIEFLRTTPMDGSITLRNVTHQDIGLYHCSVQTFPQGSWTRDIRVEDSDEAPGEEDPETPAPEEVIEADAEVVAERSDNLTISCNHEHNGTVYQVTVEKMARGQAWGIMGLCRVVDGGLVGEDYTERGKVSCADSLDVSLQLTDVVEEDGGFYRCRFTTDAGVQTTTVLLTVPSPGEFSLSVYMMYIYTGAGAAGLALLIVILIVAVRHRKRNRREEYRVKLHPSQRQPNYYENIPMRGRMGRRPKKKSDCPVYANLHIVRSHKTKRVSAL
ncbi:CD226 antigen [Centroberyx gerrardi]